MTCVHWWVIDSRGDAQCKLCRATRRFEADVPTGLNLVKGRPVGARLCGFCGAKTNTLTHKRQCLVYEYGGVDASDE